MSPVLPLAWRKALKMMVVFGVGFGLGAGAVLVTESTAFQYWWRMRDVTRNPEDYVPGQSPAYGLHRITDLGPAATPLLVRTLRDAKDTVPFTAAFYALQYMRDRDSERLLTDLAADRDAPKEARTAACSLLWGFGTEQAMPSMVAILRESGESVELRRHALGTLENILRRTFPGDNLAERCQAAAKWWQQEGKQVYGVLESRGRD